MIEKVHGHRHTPESAPAVLDDEPVVIHGAIHGEHAESDGVAMSAPIVTAPPVTTARSGDGPESTLPDIGPPASDPPVAAVRQTATETRRATSLDALRGLFLVLMTLGFSLHTPRLPLWMYHRQMPPPTYEIVDLAGIAWRDLAYAAFIFTMAAALPITLSRRLDKGETEFAVFFAAVRRFVLLFVFALLIGHSNGYFIGYTKTARVIAIIGFAIMFMVFLRRRSDWNPALFKTINAVGWIAAVAFLALSPVAYGSAFAPTRLDDIISGLAFAALSGSLIWYFTRNNIPGRIIGLGAVVALYLGARGEGWIQDWWWTSPAPWLFQPSQFTLLLVVIPGTIAGDVVLRWMRSSDALPATASPAPWGKSRIALLSFVSFLFAPLLVLGLYNRWVSATSQIAIAMCAGLILLTWNATTARERMLQQLVRWASLWLVLGLFVEPFEEGIRKVPETLSYFVVVTGITMMLFVMMAGLVELGAKKLLQPLVDVGYNPMLCYVLYSVFLNPLIDLVVPPDLQLNRSPGEAVLRMVLSTLLVVLIVRALTRQRIFWRT